MPHLRTHTSGTAARFLARSQYGRPGRRNFGVNLHTTLPVQQESAKLPDLAFQGLTAARARCIVSQAAQPRCCAEHLFRPLRLNGQVRAPIRGLPVFYPLQALAEACRISPPVRQASAQQPQFESAALHRPVWPANSAGTATSPEEGTWTCGQNLSSRRSRSAALWRPVATPPASASSTAAAQARLAQPCWMPTWSPAPLSALPQTSSIASKTRASADAPAAALNSRPLRAASDIAQTPRPGSPRARRFAFRNTKEQGTAYV